MAVSPDRVELPYKQSGDIAYKFTSDDDSNIIISEYLTNANQDSITTLEISVGGSVEVYRHLLYGLGDLETLYIEWSWVFLNNVTRLLY